WGSGQAVSTSLTTHTMGCIMLPVRAGTREAEWIAQAAIVKEVFGNPFRPIALKPAWRTPTVTALATGTYNERVLPAGTLDPDRLAVLADALEDAGCDNEDILSHLRGPGPHVRGCWVRFVDYQYRQIGAGDSSSRGQAESVRQLTNRADAIS